jgi:NAD-dependent deacetylase
MTEDILEQGINSLADLIVKSKKILIFTGAGVSTESGIPDFRSPGGFWTRFDPEDFTIQKFMSDEGARKKHWGAMAEGGLITTDANPNLAHYAIAELEKMGKLYGIVTQNVDGLHQKAGNSEDMVFQLHGDMSHARCLDCNSRYPMEAVMEWVKQGEDIPDCRSCGGILKPDAVYFGESLPMEVLAESQHRAQTCDMCIVLGSSLVVYPAANIPVIARRSKASLVIVNMEPTDMDHMAEFCIKAKAGKVMALAMEKVRERI